MLNFTNPNSYFILNKSVQGSFFTDIIISGCVLFFNYLNQFLSFLYIVIMFLMIIRRIVHLTNTGLVQIFLTAFCLYHMSFRAVAGGLFVAFLQVVFVAKLDTMKANCCKMLLRAAAFAFAHANLVRELCM